MINGHLLLNLSKTDLNSIGIGQFEKRNALFRHLESLRSTHTGFDFQVSPNNEHAQQTKKTKTIFQRINEAPQAPLTPQNALLQTPNFGQLNRIMTPLLLPQSPKMLIPPQYPS